MVQGDAEESREKKCHIRLLARMAQFIRVGAPRNVCASWHPACPLAAGGGPIRVLLLDGVPPKESGV